MQSELSRLPPPPRLIGAFTTGFDAIANHVTLIILPVLVDLYLWLGPQFKLDRLLLPFFESLLETPAPSGLVSAENITIANEAWTELLTRFNLFAALRTFPVGIPSLMSYRMPVDTPLGNPLIYHPASIFDAAGLGLLIIILGWVLGALYFHTVSKTVLELPKRSLLVPLTQVALLSLTWFGILVAAGIPTLFLLSLLNLFAPPLANAALVVLGMLSLWLALPVFFSPHGIFAGRLDASRSIRGALKMIRYTLPTSGLFLLVFLIIGQGMDFLWRTPAEDSWLTLVGIAGHAFISTALLAASFAYYRDVNSWLIRVMEQLRSKTPGQVKV